MVTVTLGWVARAVGTPEGRSRSSTTIRRTNRGGASDAPVFVAADCRSDNAGGLDASVFVEADRRSDNAGGLGAPVFITLDRRSDNAGGLGAPVFITLDRRSDSADGLDAPDFVASVCWDFIGRSFAGAWMGYQESNTRGWRREAGSGCFGSYLAREMFGDSVSC